MYICIPINSNYVPTQLALRTATSEVALLLGQKKLGAHVVIVFWVVMIAHVREM